MDPKKKALLLFQIGPVQEFIAQAAEISDLWAGSYLLSNLIYAGIKEIPDYRENLVFPNFQTDDVERALLSQKPVPTIPNRFLAFVPDDKGTYREIIAKVEKAIRGKLKEYARDLGISGAEEQAEQFLSVTWAILPEPTGKMGDDYGAIGEKLALRRNLRDFSPWREAPGFEQSPKDFLSGKEAELDQNLHLGALNLIKRDLIGRFPDKIEELGTIITKDDPYLAVIAMDGDRMGATLSSFKNEDEHRSFSATLARFASSVGEKINHFGGKLIYAGGDDVLAVVPAKRAFACAEGLADAFSKTMEAAIGKEITASAGIAFGHERAPLQDLVQKAHEAESRAKDVYDRDAMAISVFKRSGETIEWGCKWDSAAFALYDDLTEFCSKGKKEGKETDAILSARFPYKLAELLAPYGELTEEMVPVVEAEVDHAWERSCLPKTDKQAADFKEKADRYLEECKEREHLDDFLNLFLCETFINRPREEI